MAEPAPFATAPAYRIHDGRIHDGMTDLSAAQARLEAAIDRLEAVASSRSCAAGAEQTRINEALSAARAEYAQLAVTTGQVSERVDAVIRRLNALLEG